MSAIGTTSHTTAFSPLNSPRISNEILEFVSPWLKMSEMQFLANTTKLQNFVVIQNANIKIKNFIENCVEALENRDQTKFLSKIHSELSKKQSQ